MRMRGNIVGGPLQEIVCSTFLAKYAETEAPGSTMGFTVAMVRAAHPGSE